jgi:hypothetical protein
MAVNNNCPINPDCAAKLARLDERTKSLADASDRIERKVDALSNRVWGLRLRMAALAAASGGTVAAICKYLLP